MKRKPLPKKLEKEIYQQFGSQCPFCGEADVNTLQVHHIIAHAQVQAHHADNLCLTCANCHQKIENKVITVQEVADAKFKAQRAHSSLSRQRPAGSGNVLTFNGTNTGVVANTVNVTTKSSSVKQGPILGTIGSNLEQRNYAKHLIDRYHEFKKAEVGKKAMKYQVFYNSIKREFGAKWDHIPEGAFGSLVAFLQRRIDSTQLGKTRKARQEKNYATFDEHRSKAL
ncbi:MAG: HNH endonuclease [Cognatishimia sp.]